MNLNLAITLLVTMICRVFCKLDPGQCRSEHSIGGMMLRGHTFMEMTTTNWLKCVDKCNDDVRCQSFNYVITRGICELNDRTKEARPGDFVVDSERVYLKRLDKRGNFSVKLFYFCWKSFSTLKVFFRVTHHGLSARGTTTRSLMAPTFK